MSEELSSEEMRGSTLFVTMFLCISKLSLGFHHVHVFSHLKRQTGTFLLQADFWGVERSAEEMELFVSNRLESVDSSKAKVEVISADPPLIIVHNFIPKEMCSQIIDTALKSSKMKASTCGEEWNESNDRTSSTAWLTDAECQGPSRLIAEKVSRITGLDPSFMENLQVVRYFPGQEFQLHTDHQESFNQLERRGRLATCLIYLAEPDKGGETWFPGVDDDDDSESDHTGQTKVSPVVGSAVFFWNTVEKPGSALYEATMDLSPDLRMRHAGLPVIAGSKWVCNRWVHPIEYGAGVRGL